MRRFDQKLDSEGTPCIGGNIAWGAICERLTRRHTGDPLSHREGPGLCTELPD
jgi:hypothetical protein